MQVLYDMIHREARASYDPTGPEITDPATYQKWCDTWFAAADRIREGLAAEHLYHSVAVMEQIIKDQKKIAGRRN